MTPVPVLIVILGDTDEGMEGCKDPFERLFRLTPGVDQVQAGGLII